MIGKPTELWEARFPKIDSFEKVIEKLQLALRRAAEEMYKSEMLDTNMAVMEIAEVAEKYEFYKDKIERHIAIENCDWATKREWINDKVEEWTNG